MSKRSWAVVAALLYGAIVLVWALASPGAKAPAADEVKKKAAAAAPVKDVFGLTKVHEFHLEIAPKEYDKLQPVGGMRFPGGPGGPGGFPGGPGGGPGGFPGGPGAPERPPEKSAGTPADVHKGSGFGMEFPW